MPDATADELVTSRQRLQADQVTYGHIHRPFTRTLGSLTISNAGSVGMPWDDDARAAYLLIDDGVAEVIRVEYDIEAAVRALRAAGHPDSDRLTEMRRHGRFIKPRSST